MKNKMKIGNKMKDDIFEKPITKQFEFDEDVASVFDDMISRSVPFYAQNLDLLVKIISKNVQNNSTIIDLGCSTATTLLEIKSKIKKNLQLIGIDNSASMIERARKKTLAYKADIKLICDDFEAAEFPMANIIISNYTLQFIRPIKRGELVNKIFKSLEENGLFLLSEKTIIDDKKLNKDLIEIYYEFKKMQGYSDFEIAQKREALENVLVPYTDEENIKMIQQAGFKEVFILFKWANFTTFLAKKVTS